MTIFAIDPDSLEVPGCLLFMAFKTGNGQVGILKWKGTQVMLLNGV
jgi:hypothetical protein